MERTSLYGYMPEPLAAYLRRVPPSVWETVQDIRLRGGVPLSLTTTNGTVYGDVTVTAAMVRDCFMRCCQHAVHTHQAELCAGFVTTAHGMRVGIGGTAVLRDGQVVSCREITSLCIRLPRRVNGCAMPLLPFVREADRLQGLLLCGAPSSGKTTVLRDLATQLACSFAVSVVDERCELSACGGATGCDILRGYPKAVGVLQAIRTLSPDTVVVDELGTDAEWEAVLQSCYCGVAVMASAHISSVGDVRARPRLMRALENGAFGYMALLPPRARAFEETAIWKAGDILAGTGRPVDRVRLRGCGCVCGNATA